MSDNPAEDEDENREPVFINNNFDIPPLPPSPVHIDPELIDRLYEEFKDDIDAIPDNEDNPIETSNTVESGNTVETSNNTVETSNPGNDGKKLLKSRYRRRKKIRKSRSNRRKSRSKKHNKQKSRSKKRKFK